MTPKEALATHLQMVFPIFGEHPFHLFFAWKVGMLGLCVFLAWRAPQKYVWSALFLVGVIPGLFFMDFPDPVSLGVRTYLLWMCAEVTCSSIGTTPEERTPGWWFFALVALFML